MSDMVWIISVLTAVGMAVSIEPPNISHAAIVSTGRTRLPPAMSEYFIASQIFFYFLPKRVGGGKGIITKHIKDT